MRSGRRDFLCLIRYPKAMAPARAPAQLWFEYNGEHSVIRLEADSYRIGRVPSNQLSFPGAEGLSREHLAIERAGTNWVARDLGSTNGSLVNGVRISEPQILRSGDRITKFEVRKCARH
jgi:pSer/pThr/pTyr-binding forkhead associated (FHA) protein